MEITSSLQIFQACDGILAQEELSVFQNVSPSLTFCGIVFKLYTADCLSTNQVEAHLVTGNGPF